MCPRGGGVGFFEKSRKCVLQCPTTSDNFADMPTATKTQYTVTVTSKKIAGATVTETFTSKRAARAYAAAKRRTGSHILEINA